MLTILSNEVRIPLRFACNIIKRIGSILVHSDKAQQSLSITYSPKYECVIRINEKDENSIELRSPFLDREPSRVWPAFGKDGGGCEIILTKGKLKYESVVEKFPYAGVTNEFIQDSTKSDKIFVSALTQKLYDWLQSRKDEFYPKEGLSGKIVDGLGNVISWIGVPSYKRYAISCAYKENKNKDFVKLKFWGYVWEDENQQRKLSIPFEREYSLPYGIYDVKEKIKQHKDPFSSIENILSNIHNRLIPLAQDFENCYNKIIILPPHISL